MISNCESVTTAVTRLGDRLFRCRGSMLSIRKERFEDQAVRSRASAFN